MEKKIGFLSFGHWQPIPGSQVRTGRDALVQSVELAVAALRETVELVEHGAQRERHVVARVAVGDREDVEVVDLPPARLQMRQRAFQRDAEPDEARVRHGGR